MPCSYSFNISCAFLMDLPQRPFLMVLFFFSHCPCICFFVPVSFFLSFFFLLFLSCARALLSWILSPCLTYHCVSPSLAFLLGCVVLLDLDYIFDSNLWTFLLCLNDSVRASRRKGEPPPKIFPGRVATLLKMIRWLTRSWNWTIEFQVHISKGLRTSGIDS